MKKYFEDLLNSGNAFCLNVRINDTAAIWFNEVNLVSVGNDFIEISHHNTVRVIPFTSISWIEVIQLP